MSARSELTEFFEQVWKDTKGYVYLPVKTRENFRKFMIPWPAKKEAVVNHVLKFAADETAEVFYSPALYKSPKPEQENVLGSWVTWVDFDGNAPTSWPKEIAPIPTIEIQSSIDSKRHVYWELAEFTGPKKVQEINRALAYALGADLSGWDANQFLRPPFTVNRKPEYPKPIVAKILKNRIDRTYDTEAFAGVPKPKEVIKASVELSALPDIETVLAEGNWDKELLELFRTSGDEMQHAGRDRSGALQRLAYEGAEHGWTDEQIMAVIMDADDRWGKYTGRASRQRILVDVVNRARAKVGYDPAGELEGLAKALGAVKKVEDADDDKVLFSLDELADMEEISDWTVKGLLTPGGIGHITGRSGVGKTQLAMQLAADLASGRSSFLDKELPGEPLKVLVLSLEMNQHQLPHMMKPLRERYPDLKQKNFVVYAKGEMLAMNEESGQVYVEALLEDIKPDVVIADSLSFMSSADLTSDTDMKSLFGFLQRARNTFGFGMVIVHHHRKKANDAQSKKQPDTQHDVYGSYIISSTVDFILNLEERPEDIEEKTITMTMLKARFSAVPEPVKLRRNEKLHFAIEEDLVRQFTERGEGDGPNIGLG